MQLSTKAAIYSGLVFPGSGYFIVKKMARGWIAMSVSILCLAIFMIEAFHKAQIIAEKIVSGIIPYDLNIIREQIPLTPGLFNERVILSTSIIIGFVWLLSIVDSFFIAKSLEKNLLSYSRTDT